MVSSLSKDDATVSNDNCRIIIETKRQRQEKLIIEFVLLQVNRMKPTKKKFLFIFITERMNMIKYLNMKVRSFVKC